MKKVSIIVPCYNVEGYINNCLFSLCNQSLKDIEIIAVDDGSKDKTGSILDDYAKKYDNLVVIHKKNGGVSAARNDALKVASGEYIGFLDSDDWVNVKMFEKMYNAAKENDYDLVACDTIAVYPKKEMVIHSNISNNQSVNKLMIDAYAVIWNKIYKRELLEGLTFNTKMSFCEDVLFLCEVYSRVKKVGAINEPLHFYLQREGSLTYTYNDKLYHLIDSMDSIVDYYKKNKVLDKYHDEIEYTYVRYLYATFIKRLAKTKNKKEFNRGYDCIIRKVNENFPNYKNNKYLIGKKGFYLKHFNKMFAKMIFLLEKNRMN